MINIAVHRTAINGSCVVFNPHFPPTRKAFLLSNFHGLRDVMDTTGLL
uniref:Uncharacterized protein MANES_17G040800 n=1 Tax=Rhizophora mucronata TaxID=61149 RepID=A0A2P2IQM2_RHIMU